MVIELQFANRAETALAQIHRDVAKETLNHVHPRAGGRGEMHVEALVLLKPAFTFGVCAWRNCPRSDAAEDAWAFRD